MTGTAFMGSRHRYAGSNIGSNVGSNVSRSGSRARDSTQESKVQPNVNLDQCLKNRISQLNEA